ncbi:MAG TPA: hypothetical protein VFK70_00680 [Vicinamibacteria bacterium]|nr:hypothetical protein [Vicinamibacteria bacterium]
MSRHAGDRFDERLFHRLSGEDLAARAGEAILIATTDTEGRAHPALLAYGEVIALSPTVLRLAVLGASTTARNLTDRGALTLCLIDGDGATYVKAHARPLPPEDSLQAQGLAAFEAQVEDVLLDTPTAGEKAHLASGITFTADDPEGQARTWAARQQGLRRA